MLTRPHRSSSRIRFPASSIYVLFVYHNRLVILNHFNLFSFRFQHVVEEVGRPYINNLVDYDTRPKVEHDLFNVPFEEDGADYLLAGYYHAEEAAAEAVVVEECFNLSNVYNSELTHHVPKKVYEGGLYEVDLLLELVATTLISIKREKDLNKSSYE